MYFSIMSSGLRQFFARPISVLVSALMPLVVRAPTVKTGQHKIGTGKKQKETEKTAHHSGLLLKERKEKQSEQRKKRKLFEGTVLDTPSTQILSNISHNTDHVTVMD